MQKTITVLLTTVTIILLATTIMLYGQDQNIWKEFIKTPNANNFGLCASQIAQLEKRNQFKKQLLENIEIYNRYLTLVKSGNRYALELAFQIHKIIEPGGTSEDLSVAIGKTIHLMPEYFLSLLDKYEFTKESIEMVLLMYGDEYVDNIDKSIEETKTRILSFSKVKNEKLVSLKQTCISILTEHEQWLFETKKNSDLVNQLNQILKNDPEQALQKMIENNINNEMDLSGILGGDLPNDEARVAKITERIKFIEEKVKKEELLALKNRCLKILTNEKETLLKLQNLRK